MTSKNLPYWNLRTEICRGPTIQTVWFEAVWKCLTKGRKYLVNQGSFRGERRIELDSLVLEITHPGSRPLAPIVPSTVPRPTTDQYIDDYMDYLIGDSKKPHEQYTYGERIAVQYHSVVDKYRNSLKQHGGYNTNQCTISVSTTSDIVMKDPPCLRQIDTKIVKGFLHYFVYFRSWDLWAGLPTNLGGIRLLQEAMATEIEVEPGMIFAWSKGAHLYEHVWEYARILTGEPLE